MSRLADPTVCPDCRAPLTTAPHGSGCSGCGLVLSGPLAAELWRVMLSADALVERLRREPTPGATAPPLPSFPVAVAPRRGVGGSSVPTVLLALGGLCLLVFAAIFLGVAWGLLGLVGRSLVMASITAALVGLAAGLTRRGLRASAETLWGVAGGLLVLDVAAAGAAGLLGDLGSRGVTTVAGGALAALGVTGAAWSARAATGRLVSPQVTAVLGTALVALAQVARPDPALAAAVLVPVLLAAGVGAVALRLPLVGTGVGAVTALVWGVLLVAGLERAASAGAAGAWWWPLGVAALEAAVVTVALDLRRVGPAHLRSLGAAAALLPLVALGCSPALPGPGPTGPALALCGSLAVLLAVVVLAPASWARGAAGLAVLVGVVLAVPLLVAPAVLPTPGAPRPVTWVVVGLVLAAAAPVLLGLGHGRGLTTLVGRGDVRRPVAGPVALTVAVAATGLGAWSALVATGAAAGVVVAAGLVVAAAVAAPAWRWRDVLPVALVAGALAAWTAGLALWNAGVDLDSPLPAAAQTALAVPLLLAGAARDRDRAAGSAAALLTAGALLGGAAVLGWTEVARLDPSVQATLLAAYAVGLLLAAGTVLHLAVSRVVVQVLVVPVSLLALSVAPEPGPAGVTLAVVAAGLAVGTLLQRARGVVPALPGGAAAVVALLAAGCCGLAELPAPELASLPAGAVLALGGVRLLAGDRGLPSTTALAPALVTVVAPSLLLALGDPVSWRGAVVALLVVGLLVVGVAARLGAPFVAGAVGTALLALAHLEPVAAAVPRWVVIGLVGSLLLTAGITWEAGLRRVAGARRYLAALR